ncbi:hypothetical protein [Alkalihalobacillus sp. LMS39]|uniref:hypothetical protein n=1 Tax=Alkalihalobacillus sp. LMS39 TaxID=2924032 RepID=UPI001FB4C9A2|nr:hypothetical protein [Alkalihalobacillus sp. LMS39]UOE95801.1 hypothetical protein MM271_09455 [Alkalihalobacillus sp. LMS39]
MKVKSRLTFSIIGMVVIVVMTILIYLLIVMLQHFIFVPDDYILSVFKSPASSFIFIYEVYFIIGLFYLFWGRSYGSVRGGRHRSFWKNHRKKLVPIFISSNVVLFYYILTSVTVITDTKIIDHSFFAPSGKEYAYTDVIHIETGVYGKGYSFYSKKKGDFYYILHFKDHVAIDITEVGQTKDNVHEIFLIEELDEIFVKLGIDKTANPENFVYATEHLAQNYTDSIKRVIKNLK